MPGHCKGRPRRAGTIALAAMSVACLGFFGVARAADDETPKTDAASLLDSMLKKLDLKTTVGPKPGFVEATHPDPSTLTFIPTGAPHPKRPTKAKSADDIVAAKTALDAARDAQLAPKPQPKTKPKLKPKMGKPLKVETGT